MARDDKPIAAIVALAAQDDDVSPRQIAEAMLKKLRHAFPRVLHQREAGDSMAFGGKAIHFAHFGGREDFHRRDLIKNSREWLPGLSPALHEHLLQKQ